MRTGGGGAAIRPPAAAHRPRREDSHMRRDVCAGAAAVGRRASLADLVDRFVPRLLRAFRPALLPSPRLRTISEERAIFSEPREDMITIGPAERRRQRADRRNRGGEVEVRVVPQAPIVAEEIGEVRLIKFPEGDRTKERREVHEILPRRCVDLDLAQEQVLQRQSDPGDEAVLDWDRMIESQRVVEHVDLETRVVEDVPEAAEERVRLPVFAVAELFDEEPVDHGPVLLSCRQVEVLEHDARGLAAVAEAVDPRCQVVVANRVIEPDASTDPERCASSLRRPNKSLRFPEELLRWQADLGHLAQPVTNRWPARSPSRRSRSTPCNVPLK